MTEYLFTYGLLQRVYSTDSKYGVPKMPIEWLGTGVYPGVLYKVTHYPGVIYKPEGMDRVTGDIYKITDIPFFFKQMDEYEHSLPLFKGMNEYVRRKRPVYFQGETLECWVYEYIRNPKTFGRIKSGRF